jgi:DNA polymerase-3 subunit delta'
VIERAFEHAPAPRANPFLLGQKAAERTLLEAQRSDRLPHAWLLAGPRGVGKATLAYRFGRFLLSGSGEGGGLFGDGPADMALAPDHQVLRRVASGGHPDLLTVERGVNEKTGKLRGEIVVEDVRAVADFLHMTPGEGGWRIVVIDSADEMNRVAANAILKVLEEPPRQALLLLVSHAPGRLLPTIRSRCCALAIPALAETQVIELLGRYAPDLPPDDAAALACLAEGSVGRALDLAAAEGLELYRELIELLGGLPRLDVPRVHALGERLGRGADGAAFRLGTELLSWWLARMIRGAALGVAPSEVVAGEAALMARLLERRSLAQWLALWEKWGRLFARAEGANLDRKQVVVTAFLELEALAA